MKRLLAAMAVLLAVATPAAAEVVSKQICKDKVLAPSGADTYGLGNGITDCDYTDISGFYFFSYQANCNETTGDTMDIDLDWVAGSAASAAYMGIPILDTGSAMSQLQTNAFTSGEGTWTTLETIKPPVAPVGTIRITNNVATETDMLCTIILNMGR
jgi:hypothetical protein